MNGWVIVAALLVLVAWTGTAGYVGALIERRRVQAAPAELNRTQLSDDERIAMWRAISDGLDDASNVVWIPDREERTNA